MNGPLDKFCAMFQNLKTLYDQAISVDPFQYLKIEPVAFEGIFMTQLHNMLFDLIHIGSVGV